MPEKSTQPVDRTPETKRPMRAWWIVVPLLVAAIALWLWLGRGPRTHALPGYTQTWSAQLSGPVGAPQPPGEGRGVTVSAAARFEFVARPDKPVQAPVVARAALREGGILRPWDIPVEVSPEGVVRFGGIASERFPHANATYDVVLVIRGAASMSDAALLEWAAAPNRANTEGGVRVLHTTVRVLPAG